MFKVTKEPLNVQEVNTLVKRSTDGAVVTFDGIVRDNFDGRPGSGERPRRPPWA